ncbi:hypothetical protein ACFL01_02200 [Planctomycetota bacterium]
MTRRIGSLSCVLCVLLICGCVDVNQVTHLEHDGSGKIVEKISVLPRGLRLLKGMEKRGGGAAAAALLTEESFQTRLKAMGEVTVESRKDNTLKDGRREIETVYTFKDINKVNFWIVPTFGYKSKIKDGNGRTHNYSGHMKLKFVPEFVSWGRIFRETITVNTRTTHGMVGQPMSSPSVKEEYRRVLPIFLDMFKDFRVKMEVIAPIESFEEPRDMVGNVRVDGNRVTVFEMNGKGVIQSPGMVHQVIMNEVVGGGNLAKHQSAMPGVFTPLPAVPHGRWFRFMKPTPAPAEDKKK